MKTFAVIAALGAAIAPAFAKGNLPEVSVRGNAFFAGSERFYVRGVAYQPGALLGGHEYAEDIRLRHGILRIMLI